MFVQGKVLMKKINFLYLVSLCRRKHNIINIS